jgi:Flp pilus assembly protein CpaB
MGSRRIFLIIGLFIVIVAILGGVWLLRGGGAAGTVEVATVEPETIDIVIAANNLPRSTTVSPGAVQLSAWPIAQLPAEYFTSLEQVYGLTVRSLIPQGMPLMPSMLTEGPIDAEEAGSDVALTIPDGQRAIAIPVDLLGGVAWLIQPGDHVDVLASWTFVDLDEDFQTVLPNQWAILECPEETTCEGTMGRMELLPTGLAVMVFPTGPGRSRYMAQMTIQDAVVLQVGFEEGVPPIPAAAVQPAEGETPPQAPPADGGEVVATPTVPAAQVVVLLVDTQDALILKALLELQADLDLVLRGTTDRFDAGVEPVTLEFLMSIYNLDPPARLPYGVVAPQLIQLEEEVEAAAAEPAP